MRPLQVFQAIAQLPRLAELDVRSRFLHPHNQAVAALGGCASLAKLTLHIPTEFPTITGACVLVSCVLVSGALVPCGLMLCARVP